MKRVALSHIESSPPAAHTVPAAAKPAVCAVQAAVTPAALAVPAAPLRAAFAVLTAVLAAALMVLGVLPPAHLEAAEVKVTYRFDAPAVADAGDGYSRLEFPAAVQSGRPGEPSYPFRSAAILLPPGEAVAAVRVERRGWRRLDGSHRLYPMQLPVTASEGERGARVFLRSEEAYLMDQWIYPPDSPFSTQYCRGHAIAVGCFSPVGYRPLGGEVGFYGEVEITVQTETSAASAGSLELLRTDPATCARVAALVDNPADLALYGGAAGASAGADLSAAPGAASSAAAAGAGGAAISYNAAAATTADDYEYLIVTRDSLAGDFAALRDFHTRRGLRARIRTVEQIENCFSGSDTAERIRNAVIHEYVNRGITHLLLGGDADGPLGTPKVVPCRGFYGSVMDHETQCEDDDIPGDVYFAALDGNWDADGDGLWGEPGEEDLYPEIAVGRACVQTHAEVARFIGKTVLYQETPVAGQVRRALLLGEQLWEHPETWGADELEEYVGTCTENGFVTTGIPTEYGIAELFERDIYYWSREDALAEINAGTHWVAHSGHCTQDCALRFYLHHVTDANFTNDGVSANLLIIVTAGCYAAAFDNRDPGGLYYPNQDCVAEKMVKIQHCAVAFRGNSRYGWLDPGTTISTSHLFMREFYDAVFTEGYHTLGEADARSKEELTPFIELSEPNRAAEFRWDYYQLNLLGDPALDAWTDTPDSLDDLMYSTSIGRYDGSMELIATCVPDAYATLCHDGVCYARGVGTPLGYILIRRLLPFPDSIDVIELNVSAHNYYTYRDTISIEGTTGFEGPPPAISLAQNAPNPFNPATVIRFSLDREGPVDLRVYDVTGREVDRLVHRSMGAGVHAVTWRPAHLPSGVYLYVLRAGGASLSRKAVLLR